MNKGQQYFPRIFEKGYIRGREVKNRIVLPALAGSVGIPDGMLGDDKIAYYTERAKYGVGIIITEAMIVSQDTGMSLANMERFTDIRNDFQLEKLAHSIHRYDSLIFAQLLHAGREAMVHPEFNRELLGPSAIPECDWMGTPRALTHDEIIALEEDFLNAALNCAKAGLDGVELHGAHGYLINQFMSPRANQRTDEYGGSFENRMRFATNIFKKIRAAVPDKFIIGIRINGDDCIEGGITNADAVEMAKYLEKLGFDYLNVSCGSYSAGMNVDPSQMPPLWKNSYILPVKQAVSIPVFAVNTVKTPAIAEQALESGAGDYVCIGRGLMAEPEFVEKARSGRANEVHNCLGCNHCLFEFGRNVWRTHCSVNPRNGLEKWYANMEINGAGRNAVVIGGGPGGMMAAKTLAEKGYAVTLYDKNHELGGALRIGTKASGREKMVWLADSWEAALRRLGVKIESNTEIKDVAALKAHNPYIVVMATGAVPVIPGIPGTSLPNVVLAHDILNEKVNVQNSKVAIIGSGMTGMDTAEYLVKAGNQVVFYDMLDEIAKGAEMVNKMYFIGMLEQCGVQFNLLHKLKEIREKEVVFDDLKNGGEKAYPTDTVVLSLGVKPNASLKDTLEEYFDNVVVIGDANGGSFIADATFEAYNKMWDLR